MNGQLILMLAAAAVVLVIITSLVSTGALRWTSFASRVDRRTTRRHQFEASWGALISEAERRTQAERHKNAPVKERDADDLATPASTRR